MSAVIAHAGAWDVPASEKKAHVEGVRRAARAGWDVLDGGGSAAQAVQTAVMVMEDDTRLNAGRGSVLCRDGTVELAAALMEGGDLRLGAVAGVRDVPNPIRLAMALLDDEHVFLVGPGASAFAQEKGLSLCAPGELVVPRERERLAEILTEPVERARKAGVPADTVGAVAIDRDGKIAAGSSTGGRPGQRSGRIGDAPVAGCGLFADDRVAGAACTGWGEDILRVGLARRAVDLARHASAQDACWRAVREMEGRIGGRGGVVLLSRDGSVGYAFSTPSMPVAWIDSEVPEPVVGGVSG